MTFDEWMDIGLKNNFFQTLDKRFREQYGITEEPSEDDLKAAKEHFCKEN